MPENESPVALTPASGPTSPGSDPAGVGLLSGVAVQRYEFTGAGGAVSFPDAGPREPGAVRRLAIFPEIALDHGEPRFGSAAFTLRLTSGNAVTTARDQHDHEVGGHPTGPGLGGPERGLPCWMPDQWNLIDIRVPDAGDYRLELVADDGATGTGYLQDLGHVTRARAASDDPVDWVRMARGTHSRYTHSRGNTLPLVCRPHGFTFLTPITDARTRNWLYQWAPDGGARLQGLSFSHCPSPWIAERGQLQLMPFTGAARHDPVARSLAFDHDHEVDGVHHYRVEFEDGVVAEMTPTSHAGVFRFGFPAGFDGHRGVVLDLSGAGRIEMTDLPDGGVGIEAWAASGVDGHAFAEPGFYFYGETRQRARVVDEPSAPWWRRWLQRIAGGFFGRRSASVIELADGDELEIAIATSAISIEQARVNLAAEVGARRFDDVLAGAREEWSGLLSRLQLSAEATDDQRVTAYSNLARLHCWPNAAHEWVGDLGEGRWVHASPYRAPGTGDASRETAHELVDGTLFVNNGFWDTYRTAWPHYAMFTPDLCDDLLEGTVQQYREGGWTARWSGASYIDCMPGASADVVFADAAANGRSFDELAAYDSAIRNGSVPAPNRFVGRKGLDTSRFTGFTDTATPEGMSWQLENAITNDAVARWSASLAARADALGVPERRAEFVANAAWFGERALNYRNHFDRPLGGELGGFFTGRRPDGSWRGAPEAFDPLQWGRDYTETNAWGMSVTAWHDGVGLAELYGGEAGLARRLDAMFATQERATASVAGGYADVIHEMTEARAIRCGMAAMSNQPAHHVPFMYLHAGQPAKTQWWTREMLDRLFVGSEIGQGYPGDEDNGEMSAWWLWAAMGLYPLHPGSGELVLTAPLLGEMSFDRGASGRLTVRADKPEHRFIQAVRIDGEPWDAVTVPVARLAGDVTIEFELGPEPSAWGAGTRPISASAPGARQWRDQTSGASVVVRKPDGVELDAACLVDDVGNQVVEAPAGSEVVVRWSDEVPARLFTLTRDDVTPVDWALTTAGASDGVRNAGVSPRTPTWPNQTVAYLLDGAPASELRLSVPQPMLLRQLEVWA